jgi:hypothetical protein
MSTAVLGAVLALLAIFVVTRLVMRRRLLVKYAALWLALVILALVPGILDFLSRTLGFEVPANMLFFVAFGLLLFVTLQMSVELTSVEARIQRLAEELAIAQSSSADGDASVDDR